MEFIVPEILENRARDYPDKVAVVIGSQTITYRGLDEGANALAEHLVGLGTEKSDRIGVLLDKSIESVLSVYGIAKSGGVFVPINHRLRRDQVVYTVRNCSMKCVITSDRHIAELPPEEKVRVLNTNQFKSIMQHTSNSSGKRAASIVETDIAAILYTSGSTGRPKGAVLNHRNLVTGAHIVARYLENRFADRIISVLPFNFDYGLNQLLTCHLVGGTLVLQRSMHPKHICDTLIKERITGFAGVPTIWVQLLQRYSPFRGLSFPDLRYITNSGGTIPLRYLNQLREILGDTRIYLMYGLTEAFRSTYLAPEDLERRPTSIGKAIPNVEIRILNEHGEECGPGEPGELVHRGANIFLGYWNDLEATAKMLRPFPFCPEGVPHREMAVYSGDIVTRDEEGFFYFLGRKDNLIKSAGYRISPQEIEDILYQMSGIKEAAVLGIDDELLGHRIKAFVSCRDEASIEEKEVLDFCAERIPDYMVPHTVVFLKDLPKTMNEKIDRVALRREYGHGEG